MSAKRVIDINADLGEGFGVYRYGADELIMPHITSANVAAGFHASDPCTLYKAVEGVVAARVKVGAHIGYPDRLGFGRRHIQISPQEAYAYTIYQLGAVYGFAKSMDVELSHVKLHGAMYMDACATPELAEATVKAVKDFDEGLVMYTLPSSFVESESKRQGVDVWTEFFADRPYSDGSVRMFNWKLSEIGTPEDAATRTLRFLKTDNGRDIRTVCVHSDTPNAPEIIRAVRNELDKHFLIK